MSGRAGLIMEARGPPDQSGSVLVSGSIGTDGSAAFDVTAAGIAVFRSANGDQAIGDEVGYSLHLVVRPRAAASKAPADRKIIPRRPCHPAG